MIICNNDDDVYYMNVQTKQDNTKRIRTKKLMHIKTWDRTVVEFIYGNSLVPICKVKIKLKLCRLLEYLNISIDILTRCRTVKHIIHPTLSLSFSLKLDSRAQTTTSCETSKNVWHEMITIFVVISSVMNMQERVSMNFIIKLWNNAMNPWIRKTRNTFTCTFRLNKLKALHREFLKLSWQLSKCSVY